MCLHGPLKDLIKQHPLCTAGISGADAPGNNNDERGMGGGGGDDGANITRCSPAMARRLWQPVNRRRVVGRGWHIDVGPGFGNDEVRTTKGDARQGVILLVLLSDWAPGG
jgi:hypothetical protein